MALISIVTGTYNRLSSLQAMMHSVRAQLPRGIDCDFIVCDGGSSDGTLAWLRTQPDVRLLEHGELRGAIRAFTDAARLSTARYTVMANDDITFLPGSLVKALVHLEEHPTCGAVAFAHNINAPGHVSVWGDWYAATMPAQPQAVIYAQVGMFRTALGHEAGWWGADDRIMQTGGGTYGGDNYLSARIWEMGYSVDTLPGVGNVDHLHDDALRAHNRERELSSISAYHKRYPQGVKVGAPPVVTKTSPDVRVLYLPIYEPGHPNLQQTKRGFREAMQRAGLMVYEWDYINVARDLSEIVRGFRPHLLFAQFQDAHFMQPEVLAAARAAHPSMVVINWNGDVWDVGLKSPAVLALLAHVDLQLTVNASVVDEYEAMGIPSAYWQWAAETVAEPLPRVNVHDVVFLGNNYSPQRAALGKMLKALPHVQVGIYGRPWKGLATGENLYDYATGAALYRAAKLAIGDSQFSARGFVSNRLFEALSNGACLLHQTVPGMEDLLGFIDGEHYIAWTDLDDLRAKILYWLQPEQDAARARIRQAGQAYARAHHSFDVRVRELFALIPKAKAAWELRQSSSSRLPLGTVPTP